LFGIYLFVDLAADIHDACNLWPPREIIFVLHRFGREARGKLFRIVVRPSCHPAGRFHSTSEHVVIGVFFVMCPRIPADDGIDFEEADHEDYATNHLV
jgi:hypothetical protein